MTVTWRKASFCAGGDCVEIGVAKKSTYSNPTGSCVEVEGHVSGVFVRDAKSADSPVLEFTKREWDAFVKGVKAGEFDFA